MQCRLGLNPNPNPNPITLTLTLTLTLIKTFLRDLPDDLWGASRPALDAAVAEAMAGRGTGEPGELLRQLPARSASLFAWCCDACAAIVAHEADNSMNVTAVRAHGIAMSMHMASSLACACACMVGICMKGAAGCSCSSPSHTPSHTLTHPHTPSRPLRRWPR